jgi:hypothetical protein
MVPIPYIVNDGLFLFGSTSYGFDGIDLRARWPLFERGLTAQTSCGLCFLRSRNSVLGIVANQEIALAVSAGSLGMFIGFLAGYAVRSDISCLHHRPKQGREW